MKQSRKRVLGNQKNDVIRSRLVSMIPSHLHMLLHTEAIIREVPIQDLVAKALQEYLRDQQKQTRR